MRMDQVIKIYNELLSGERKTIEFNKGYESFERCYELFKEYNLKRKEITQNGYILVQVYVK